MVVFLVFAPKAAAGGWLTAFVFWSGLPIGSLVAIMIHKLTGGRWGEQFAAVFIPTAAALPLTIVLLVPVLAALPGYYSWTFGSGRVDPVVADFYLNVPFFIGRSLLALIVWSVLAFVLPPMRGTAGVIVGGLGLAFYGLMIGIVGTDWILSLEPMFMSTSFGATLGFVQLASAFAWAGVLSPGQEQDPAVGDIGGLLLATLLGTTYINFMAVLVIWYGDLPSQVFWFVQRDHWPWTLLAGFVFVCGSVIPIFSLFIGRIRSSRLGLRIVGLIALTGIALYFAYLVAPTFGVLSLGAGIVAIVAVGALLIALIATPWSQTRFYRWRAARGR